MSFLPKDRAGVGLVFVFSLVMLSHAHPLLAQAVRPPATRPATAPAGEPAQRPEDALLFAQLERNVPEIRFDGIGFEDTVEFFRDITGSNIYVNWQALEAAGIKRDAQVSARLRDVKFSKALEVILKDVGGEKVALAYTVDKGVLRISTSKEIETNPIATVYGIGDLLVLSERTAPQKSKELIDALIELITDTIARDTWKANGGKIGSIHGVGGQLVVVQTPETQQQIQKFLTQLRESRGVQIVIQARLIDMPRARAAALNAAAQAEGLVVDDTAIANFTGPEVKVVAAPRITTYVGQSAAILSASEDLVFNVSVNTTISEDGKLITVTLQRPGPAIRTSSTIAPSTGPLGIVSIPEGSTGLVKFSDGTEREQWLAIKPTLILPRDRPATQPTGR